MQTEETIRFITLLAIVAALPGCAHQASVSHRPRPNVAPTEQLPTLDTTTSDRSVIHPMYTEILAIDLPTVVRVAAADSIAIQQARLEVQAAGGRKDAAIGNALPALSPNVLFETVNGKVRATEGNLVSVSFNSFQAFLAIDWVLNPGRSYYEIVAARKRLAATEHQERAVVLDTLHAVVIQYYDLVLAQSRVAVANQALEEAKELVRINELRLQTGTAVEADRLRAASRLAERSQDLALAMNDFYRASITLALTLRLDSAVTLVPNGKSLSLTTLVRPDIHIDELLAYAVEYRPDLESIRMLVEAVQADKGAAVWGGFGPQFQTAYQIGGISGHVEKTDQSFDFSRQERFHARAGWRLGLSTLGTLRTAKAVEQQTILEAQGVLERIKSQVIVAQRASQTNFELIDMAKQQVQAAQEALRLTQINLQSGTMTTLDVLEAGDALERARLRRTQAIVGYNQSQADLLAAIGLLDQRSFTIGDTEIGEPITGDQWTAVDSN